MNPDAPLRTKNLKEEDPCPMDDTLAGYPWLPRMIDKARAARADRLGGYYRYPCPIDSHFLDLLRLDPDVFADLAVTARSGADVIDGLARLGARTSAEAAFDPIALNEQLHGPS